MNDIHTEITSTEVPLTVRVIPAEAILTEMIPAETPLIVTIIPAGAILTEITPTKAPLIVRAIPTRAILTEITPTEVPLIVKAIPAGAILTEMIQTVTPFITEEITAERKHPAHLSENQEKLPPVDARVYHLRNQADLPLRLQGPEAIKDRVLSAKSTWLQTRIRYSVLPHTINLLFWMNAAKHVESVV